MVDSELEQRIRRIVAIRRELQALYSQTQPGLTAAGVGIWIVSGGLTVAGLALAVPSGGSSLLLSVAGMVVFLVDMARQIQIGTNPRTACTCATARTGARGSRRVHPPFWNPPLRTR